MQMPTAKRFVALALATCGTVGASLWSQAQPVAGGGVLTTPAGRTLYVFDNDVPGSERSVCNPPCSNIFPPYLVEEGASAPQPFGVVRRDDGLRQWSYKGRPLYLFYADEKRGDVNGDGMNRGIWHVARP
jgi:predicted lipoprotein with Yx(FWY)xxD motif